MNQSSKGCLFFFSCGVTHPAMCRPTFLCSFTAWLYTLHRETSNWCQSAVLRKQARVVIIVIMQAHHCDPACIITMIANHGFTLQWASFLTASQCKVYNQAAKEQREVGLLVAGYGISYGKENTRPSILIHASPALGKSYRVTDKISPSTPCYAPYAAKKKWYIGSLVPRLSSTHEQILQVMTFEPA